MSLTYSKNFLDFNWAMINILLDLDNGSAFVGKLMNINLEYDWLWG